MDIIRMITDMLYNLGFYDNGWIVNILGEFLRCALIIATLGLPIVIAIGFILYTTRLAYDYK